MLEMVEMAGMAAVEDMALTVEMEVTAVQD